MFKALSKQFKDKLLFGEIRKSSTDLIAKFQVTAFPTLLVLTDPSESQGETFKGEMKMDQLNKFLNQYSYKTASYEKKLEFQQLTVAKHKAGLCKGASICLIFFTQRELVELLKENQVKPLLQFYKNDPLQIVWVDRHDDAEL